MSTNRISRNRGFIKPSKLPKGPNGRALCRWCQTEVGKGRRTFCSDDCVHQHKLRTQPGYLREQVFKRDRGVCAICRVDTVAEQKRLYAGVPMGSYGERRRIQAETGFAPPGVRSPWDADHIIPVVEGGGECDLDNIRTLCIKCHKGETRELATRRAIVRRMEVQESEPEPTEHQDLFFTIDEALDD